MRKGQFECYFFRKFTFTVLLSKKLFHIGVIPLICLQFLNNYLKIINKNRDITLFFLRLFVEKHIMKLRANE